MKIGIYTTELGQHVSGGILCIVETLNALVKAGHDCVCFVDKPPYRSDWLHTNFPVEPVSNMSKYDGILVSPYSPTAEAVSKATNAEDRFYWVHTNESLFCHNGKAWQDMARQSYDLPIKIFCTASYLQIIMETIFNRHVIGTLVPPGVDSNIFTPGRQSQGTLYVGMLNRPGWVRGVDAAQHAIGQAIRLSGLTSIQPVAVPHTNDRKTMAYCYQRMDVYLDMSRVAGSPTPVKEAMACGAIPICTKYGTTDFVLDGHNGFIAPVDDPAYVANLLVNLHDSYELRQQIAQSAVDTAQQYTWDKIAARFISAISEGKSRGDELLKKRDWYIQR